jgi:predicted dehydrogenase
MSHVLKVGLVGGGIGRRHLAAFASLPDQFQLEPLPEGFAGQFYRFHQALHRQAGAAELPVTLADARAALELITAVYLSARKGQIVSLPIGQAHPYYTGWLL